MYGPSGREWFIFMLTIALIGGGLAVGCEHGCAYIVHHVSVGLK